MAFATFSTELNKFCQFVLRFDKSRGCTGEPVKPIECKLNFDVPGCWEWKNHEDTLLDILMHHAVEDGVDTVT